MRIHFIRHAESEANVGAVSQPNKTIRLTARGHEQAQALLADISWEPRFVFVSEYLRTHQTAAPILDRFNAFCWQVRRVITLFERGAIPDGSVLFGHGLWISVFLWLSTRGIKSDVKPQERADFFDFLKRNHPRNCQVFTLKQ